jgi:hypothetical protein
MIHAVPIERRRASRECPGPCDRLAATATPRQAHDLPASRPGPSGIARVGHDLPIGSRVRRVRHRIRRPAGAAARERGGTRAGAGLGHRVTAARPGRAGRPRRSRMLGRGSARFAPARAGVAAAPRDAVGPWPRRRAVPRHRSSRPYACHSSASDRELAGSRRVDSPATPAGWRDAPAVAPSVPAAAKCLACLACPGCLACLASSTLGADLSTRFTGLSTVAGRLSTAGLLLGVVG